MNKAVLAAGLGFTVSAVVGCGSSGDLLSSAQAKQLSSQLRKAEQALNASQCGAAAGSISDFQTKVDELGSVNSTLVNNLQAGATKIENLAAKDCPTDTTPTPTHTHTTPPHTTPTVTTVTETVSTTTSTPTDTSTTDTDTGTNTSTTDTDTQTSTGVTTTNTDTAPSSGLTGPLTSTTSSTPTSTSGGSGLNGTATESAQRRGAPLPPGWQRSEGQPGGPPGHTYGYRHYQPGGGS